MKKMMSLSMLVLLFVLAACGSSEAVEDQTETETESESTSENSGEELGDENITFGMPSWTSSEAPTAIAKQILEEAGYEVEVTLLSQPVIFEGLQSHELDFFMDAWLPYTEAALWEEYKGDLQKIATSYENVPLGWVVPSYVEEETIDDLAGKAEKFDGEVVTIEAGAGIVDISEEVFADEDYDLEGFELVPSSESAMMGVIDSKMKSEEPFIVTGWRPHSMFAKYDLKFLEDTQEHFKYDNVYVLSYQELEEEHPKAYEVMSQWSIEVADLEAMMLAYEEEGTPFEESAAQWIEEHRDQVDQMLGK